jgi:phage baseplate assembly protein gpV
MFHTLLETESADYKNLLIVGKVIVNDDSSETVGPKLQRIKVSVPGLYEGDSANFPWVFPKQQSLFGIGDGFGTFGVPAINSYVLIELQDGDPLRPVYVSGILLQGLQLVEAGVNYPFRYGFKDPAGNLFYIDTKTGSQEVKFVHKSGTTINILDSGAITISAGGQDITLTANNLIINANIQTTGTLTSNGKSVDDSHTHSGVTAGGDDTGPVN